MCAEGRAKVEETERMAEEEKCGKEEEVTECVNIYVCVQCEEMT